MELCSLHPFEESALTEFVALASGDESLGGGSGRWPAGTVVEARHALAQMAAGDSRGPFALTYALARGLAAQTPTFAHAGLSLTTWEARVDRGIGMLMRPPARLLIDAGLEPMIARKLPIRLDLSHGTMGGAYLPARLMEQLDRQLDGRLERSVRRLVEAEADALAVMGLMVEVVAYARANGLALFEAIDVVNDYGDALGIPTAQILLADKRRLDRGVRARIEVAAKPPKKPGLWARLIHRGSPPVAGSPGNQEPPA